MKLKEDVNEIFYCQNNTYEAEKWVDTMKKSAKHINDLLKKEQNYSEEIDIQEFLEQLEM